MDLTILFLFTLLFSPFTQVELPLYKAQKNYDFLTFNNATIESIEHSHFLTDLKLGSPIQSIPLEISMSSEEILILNNKTKNYKKPILSDKTSRTFQIIKNTKENKVPAIDKFVIYKNTFDLQFKSIDTLSTEDPDKDSSGILGFSLGNIENKIKNKFVDQLNQNLLITNSIFYFNLETNNSKNQVISLEDYLNIKGKIIVGYYPNYISPDDSQLNEKYILKTAPIVQKLQMDPNADPILLLFYSS